MSVGGATGGPEEPRVVEVREGSIRLGQLLKLADLADTGAEARALVAEGEVSVNGEVETRRGRQLAPGDVVTVDLPAGPRSVRVVPADPASGTSDDLPW